LKLRILGALALVASSAISYWPSLRGGFIWDDETLIAKSSIIQSSSGLYRIWFTSEPIDYWPVTNTSALELKPDYAEAYNNLGMVILNRGQPGEAVQLLEKAVGIKPKYAEAHTNLGVALMNLGRPEDAMGHFQKAVAVDNRFPEAHYNLGNALLIAGRPTEAIEQYEAALKSRDNFCEAYANMAMALAKLNRLEEARAMAHQALDLAKLQGKTEFAQQIKDWLASNRIDSNE
jgi:tetratricopeptide (TPR) repeat protein